MPLSKLTSKIQAFFGWLVESILKILIHRKHRYNALHLDALLFFFSLLLVAVSKAESQDNIVQESLTSENWMWPRYFYKGCRIAKKKKKKKKLESRSTKIFTWAIGVILSLEKFVWPKNMPGKGGRTRMTDKSFRVPESWGEVLTKHVSEGKPPNQDQEGNHYHRLRILPHGQNWGKCMSPFIFLPFSAFIWMLRVMTNA